MSEAAKQLTADALSRVGSVIASRYKLVRLLGSGGMGAVYEAENAWTHRRVAVKLMHQRASQNVDATKRFLREAQAATRIGHPNIVDVLDMGQADDGTLFIVQEFLLGHDLARRLDLASTLTPRATVTIVLPIVSALVAAHRKGIIHRDVKPENIFLTRGVEGETIPKLIDFGISKINEEDGAESLSLTRTGTMMGTPFYMSPEQARGQKDVAETADAWSIGVVMFECLTGRVPFEAENYNALIAEILTADMPRLREIAPSAPRELADVIDRLLERDLGKRLRSMQALHDALTALPIDGGDAAWGEALVAPIAEPSAESALRETMEAPVAAITAVAPPGPVSPREVAVIVPADPPAREDVAPGVDVSGRRPSAEATAKFNALPESVAEPSASSSRKAIGVAIAAVAVLVIAGLAFTMRGASRGEVTAASLARPLPSPPAPVAATPAPPVAAAPQHVDPPVAAEPAQPAAIVAPPAITTGEPSTPAHALTPSHTRARPGSAHGATTAATTTTTPIAPASSANTQTTPQADGPRRGQLRQLDF